MSLLEELMGKARAESFNANIILDIEKLKKQLDKRIAQLRIMGNQYEAHRKQQLLTHLDNVKTKSFPIRYGKRAKVPFCVKPYSTCPDQILVIHQVSASKHVGYPQQDRQRVFCLSEPPLKCITKVDDVRRGK